MSTLTIDDNALFSTIVEVRESDRYSESIYVSFDRKYHTSDSADGCSEMFLTPAQLNQIGKFLMRMSEEIKTEQRYR